MLDLTQVRNNLTQTEDRLRTRNPEAAAPLGNFAIIDRQRREAITQLETLNAERNRLTTEIQAARKSGADANLLTEQVRTLKAQAESLQTAADTADTRLRDLLATLPNLPAPSVPLGTSEHDNVVAKTWGEIPTFPFPPKPHWEIGEDLGILDFNRAAKISGARFALHFAQGARLERALAAFMLDLHTREHGYTEVLPPPSSTPAPSSPPASSPNSLKTSSTATTSPALPPASSSRTITGSSPPPRSLSPTSSVMKPSTSPTSPSLSAPSPAASALRPARTAKTPAVSSASTNFKKWSS